MSNQKQAPLNSVDLQVGVHKVAILRMHLMELFVSKCTDTERQYFILYLFRAFVLFLLK